MKKSLYVLILLWTLSLSVYAQSVSYAKSLIEQGKYLEAAKQLRPLADGGNAEAQYLAATFFFEGKGVTKNDTQGLKYANLAANQGNVDAMCLLASYYEKKDPQRFFSTFKQFIDKHPYLETGVLGLGLAGCYLNGYGTEKNEALGWSILEKNENAEKYIRENANDYWNFKMRQAGTNSIEDFADYLYTNNKKQYTKLLGYMDDQGYLNLSSLMIKAKRGNGWASARLAEYYNGRGMTEKAKEYAQKAVYAGSNYGKDLSAEYNYVSKSYTNITTTSRPRNFAIGKVTRNYKTTEVDVVYNNRGYTDWITLNPDIYLSCNGRRYQLVRSSNDLNKRIIVSNRKTYTVTLTFQAIPESTNAFTMIEPNGDTWRDVTFR